MAEFHDAASFSEPPPSAETASASGPSATDRAEVLLAALTHRFVRAASTTNSHLQRWTARTREELEDIWAEAQSVSRRTGTSPTTSSNALDMRETDGQGPTETTGEA